MALAPCLAARLHLPQVFQGTAHKCPSGMHPGSRSASFFRASAAVQTYSTLYASPFCQAAASTVACSSQDPFRGTLTRVKLQAACLHASPTLSCTCVSLWPCAASLLACIERLWCLCCAGAPAEAAATRAKARAGSFNPQKLLSSLGTVAKHLKVIVQACTTPHQPCSYARCGRLPVRMPACLQCGFPLACFN